MSQAMPDAGCYEVVICGSCDMGWGLMSVPCGSGGGSGTSHPWTQGGTIGQDYDDGYTPGVPSPYPSNYGGSGNISTVDAEALYMELGPSSELLEEHFAWINSGLVRKVKIKSFLLDKNFSEEAYLYIKEAINLIKLDSSIKMDRLTELFDLLSENPNALIENCFEDDDEHQIEFWNDLVNFDIPQECEDRLDDLGDGWANQPIETGNGLRVNFDYFSININTLPDLDSDENSETIANFYDYFKDNFNDFIGEGFGNFQPLTQSDSTLWQSNNALTTVFTIDIGPTSLIGDDGSVICSQEEDCCWVFSTIETPGYYWISNWDSENTGGSDFKHPVSGNRQFGYNIEPDGSFTFYTKGADRANMHEMLILLNLALYGAEELAIYYGGDQCWSSLMTNFEAFVSDNDGVSANWTKDSKRPSWHLSVQNIIRQNTPITEIPCSH